MSTHVHLPPGLERFTHECVESGRYNTVSDIVCAGLRLLQDYENRRHQFQAMLEETEAEAARNGTFTMDNGTFTMDEVSAEVKAIIGKAR